MTDLPRRFAHCCFAGCDLISCSRCAQQRCTRDLHLCPPVEDQPDYDVDAWCPPGTPTCGACPVCRASTPTDTDDAGADAAVSGQVLCAFCQARPAVAATDAPYCEQCKHWR